MKVYVLTHKLKQDQFKLAARMFFRLPKNKQIERIDPEMMLSQILNFNKWKETQDRAKLDRWGGRNNERARRGW